MSTIRCSCLAAAATVAALGLLCGCSADPPIPASPTSPQRPGQTELDCQESENIEQSQKAETTTVGATLDLPAAAVRPVSIAQEDGTNPASTSSVRPVTPAPTGMIVESANQFALDLYRQISSKGGNLFFSPASLSVALAMTYAGTAGDTKTEIARTLHFDMPDDEVHLGVKTLQELWTTADGKTGVRLNLANRLWGQHRYEFRPEFLEITRDAYGAELAQLDFAQSEEATEAAAATGSALELTSARIEQPKDARIFRVDHPFVYVVRDSRNDAILFIGRAANPLE